MGTPATIESSGFHHTSEYAKVLSSGLRGIRLHPASDSITLTNTMEGNEHRNRRTVLAARHNPRVQRVIAITPYDYDAGRGLRRSSGIANPLFGLNDVPVIGPTVMRLRQYSLFEKVMEGGVAHKNALPLTLLREMYEVGNRPGHYRAFMPLVAHWAEWETARAVQLDCRSYTVGLWRARRAPGPSKWRKGIRPLS